MEIYFGTGTAGFSANLPFRRRLGLAGRCQSAMHLARPLSGYRVQTSWASHWTTDPGCWFRHLWQQSPKIWRIHPKADTEWVKRPKEMPGTVVVGNDRYSQVPARQFRMRRVTVNVV
jgi:hypothetical protein